MMDDVFAVLISSGIDVEYVSLNILQNVLVIGVLNVKKGYVPNVKNIIACLKALEHMTLFQLKISSVLWYLDESLFSLVFV
jgi:hypothetical protein